MDPCALHWLCLADLRHLVAIARWRSLNNVKDTELSMYPLEVPIGANCPLVPFVGRLR